MLWDGNLSFGDDVVLVDDAISVEDAGGFYLEDDDGDFEGVQDGGPRD